MGLVANLIMGAMCATSILRFPTKRLDIKVLPVKLPVARVPIGIVTLKNRMLSPAELANPSMQPSPTNVGAFREPCNFSHMAFDDPIVFPGQPGRSQLARLEALHVVPAAEHAVLDVDVVARVEGRISDHGDVLLLQVLRLGE